MSVDYKPDEGLKTVGGIIGNKKNASNVMNDAMLEAIGFGLGIGTDKLNTSNFVLQPREKKDPNPPNPPKESDLDLED